MRIATYNVENLFTRARALNLYTWAEGRPILERYAEFNQLVEEPVYTDGIKARLLAVLGELGLSKSDEARYVILRQTRGALVKRRTVRGAEIVASGRADWVGWLEMRTELINETATRNTAQVVRDLDADVIGIVECESRSALMQLSNMLLPMVGATPYPQMMLIDGNDDRGIDVGIMARAGYEIGWMKSHVDDRAVTGERIFSRDCPEYCIWTPSGASVWVLVNHFKSKGYGRQETSNAKRWLQAEAVRRILGRLQAESAALVAVIGDFNDTPESEALAPLLRDSGFRDVSEHARYMGDGHPGTYQRGTAKEKIDYLLLSPALFERVQQGGVWRRGVWGPNKTPGWEVYAEMTKPSDAASDHAALWVDVDV